MIHRLLTAACLLLALSASAQVDTTLKLTPKDTVEEAALRKIIQLANLKSLITRQFSYVLTGSSKSQVGNFASVNLTQPAAAFNYSFVFNNGGVLSMNGSADLKNGLAPIFNNSSLNTDISLQAKYSFLAGTAQQITVNQKEIIKYGKDYDALTLTYKENLVMSANQLELSFMRQKALVAEISRLKKLIGEETDGLRIARHKERLMVNQDSLNAMRQHVRNIYQLDISSFTSFNDAEVQKALSDYQKKLSKDISKQQKSLLDQYSPPGFYLKWLDVSYKITNTAFSLFDPLLAYTAQVKKTNFIAHSVSIDYNWYKYNVIPWHSWYLSVGADPFIGDNLSVFPTQNMSDIHTYSISPNTRTSTKTYTAYVDSGKYKRNLKGIKLHADFFYFMFKNNLFAVHLNPQVTYSQTSLPEYDEGIGFFFSFKDGKDTTGKALINSELYCNFMDVTNSAKKPGNFTGRNSIGLRFTLPINFAKSSN